MQFYNKFVKINKVEKGKEENVKAKIIEFLNRDFVKNYGKYILAGILLVIFIILFAIGILNGRESRINTGELDTPDNETGSVVAVPSGEKATTKDGETVSAEEFESGKYPFIDTLVKNYYTALANNDVDSLSKVVDSMDSIPLDELTTESQYIESYNNIECYTKEGLLDNTYIVLVYYEIKFLNVETLAPGSTCLYVEVDESNNPYIYTQALSDDVKAYRDLVLNDDFVKTLYSTTERKLEEAMSKDEQLKELIKAINTSTEKETTADGSKPVSEATTAAETTTAAGQETTKAQPETTKAAVTETTAATQAN